MSKRSDVPGLKKPVLDDRNAFKGASGTEYFILAPEEGLGIDRKRSFDGSVTKLAFGQVAKSGNNATYIFCRKFI